MEGLFSDRFRRNPYPFYQQMRSASPVHYIPPPFDAWMIFDYQSVQWVFNDHEAFSSQVPSPPHWMIFMNSPSHTKLRALVSQAFTPRTVANLAPRIQELSRQLLSAMAGRREVDLVAAYSGPLPMMVIAGIMGMPVEDSARFNRWSDAILRLSHTRSGEAQAAQALAEFSAVSAEMATYIARLMELRRASPQDDILTKLVMAEVNGRHLNLPEIIGFMQLLMVAGQETTTNLINNTILCLAEHPGQRALLEERLDLIPSAIDEVLRYRSPVQWMMRTPRREVEVHGQAIPAGKLVLPVIGSANRDAAHFPDADRFDITRTPNPHIAFGHGIHFCLGAALARLEARVAVTDLLQGPHFEVADPNAWKPREALHVYGPAELTVHFSLDGG